MRANHRQPCGDDCPLCDAQIAEAEDGPVYSDDDWDDLEAGALWNYPPGWPA